MARLIDTTAAFEAFARKAGLQSPVIRESLWKERYEAAHPEVFEAFYATAGEPSGRTAVVRELSKVRARAEEAAPVVREHIRQLEGPLPEALGVPAEPAPAHVLLVGTFTTNATVGRLGDDVAVFHCLEWFQTPEGARVLVAHETTHAWHQIDLHRRHEDVPGDDDPVWVAFTEGLAIQASRAVVPDRPDEEYFWYGHPESAWLPWCREQRDELLHLFADAVDEDGAAEAFFGGGLVAGQWRVGYYVADELVRGLGRSLPDLVAMSVEEAKAAVRAALAELPPLPEPEPPPDAAPPAGDETQ